MFVKNILENGFSVANSNSTFLVLIPKIELPESILHFRPISLCNVSYEIITKLIALRLRDYIGNLVGPNHASLFVPIGTSKIILSLHNN